MKILFMGTPDFAVPSLRELVRAGHHICGVFTQPDKPKNRGLKLEASPVKRYALEQDIPVYQPVKMRDGQAMDLVRQLDPQLIVAAAYGRILPREILEYPPMGCINVHSSLLPRYRGAAPINWAVLNGDEETGVTIMEMAEELDAGDILAQCTTPIDPDEPVTQLWTRLAEMGSGLLVSCVEQIEAGAARPVPQDPALVTYAPMLSRELSPMDFTRPARELHNQVRGLIPWPSAITELDGVRCKVFSTSVCQETTHKAPGAVVQADKRGLKMACGGGTVLQIHELQPDGKKRMAATAFLLGHPLKVQ